MVASGRLLRLTLGTHRVSCSPCSGFGINTTILYGDNGICANYGIRGTTCAPADYTREATIFGTMDRNRESFRTVTVIKNGNSALGSLYTPYNIYHRILTRFYDKRLEVVLNGPSSVELFALGSVLPLSFKGNSLGWAEILDCTGI